MLVYAWAADANLSMPAGAIEAIPMPTIQIFRLRFQCQLVRLRLGDAVKDERGHHLSMPAGAIEARCSSPVL